MPYLAPEVLQGKKGTEAVDMWAVGVLIYELLSGAFPSYHPCTSMLLIYELLSGVFPSYYP